MDTQKKIREPISALSDGALPTGELELAFAALQTPDGQQAWATYHRIGDVLRAQATPDLSAGFGARLAARLAAEPVPRRQSRQAQDGAGGSAGSAKRGGGVAERPAAPSVAAGPPAAEPRAAGELPEAPAVAHAKPAVVRVS